MTEIRGSFSSRIGFILAAAGSAIGLGNIWKFPSVTGANGGGAFLIIYVGMVLAIGFSVMMAELAIGRAAERNPVGAFRRMKGGPWVLVGYLGVVTGFVILSFYSVVGGWTLAYALKSVSGQLAAADTQILSTTFGAFTSGTAEPLVYHAIFMLLTAVVVGAGVGGGIERAAKFLMPVLLFLIVMLIVQVLSLDGAAAGLRFFFAPDFSKVTGDTVIAAMGQAFFSLSLGMGTMITYGSYLSRKVWLPSATATVTLLDTLVAVLAGMLILPAVFAFGFDPGAGPGLTFITLPAVFAQMPGGAWVGMAFFVLLAIAALTSAVSLLEVVVAYFVDEHEIRRNVATVIAGTIIFLLGIPSSLAMGVMNDVTLFGMNFLALMDYAASNVMLPVGGILISIFAAWFVWPRVIEEASGWERSTFPGAGLWRFVLGVVAPVGIALVLINGL